jgi:hypothetical protein
VGLFLDLSFVMLTVHIKNVIDQNSCATTTAADAATATTPTVTTPTTSTIETTLFVLYYYSYH